jgi:glutathione S-transferase
LKNAGVEFESRKVPFSKKKRPEVVELTGQSRVPVLVDGEEVIHDSKRIKEYVEDKWPNR